MTLPADLEMKAGSSCAAAATERLRWSADLRPARASVSCIRALCDSLRHSLAEHAEYGQDGLVDVRPTIRDNAPRRRTQAPPERSHAADLCGIVAG